MLGLGSGINRLSAAEAAAIAVRIPGFTGLLDESYGASAEAAYSVRKLTNRVSVAMTIRRDSDSTEADIGFDSNGNLDEGAITAFCTGTTCRVASWKDQSGNDNHAVQAVASNQPTIYTGGALVKEQGRVALQGTSTSKLPLSSTVALSNEASIFTLCTTKATANPWGGDSSGTGQLTWIYFANVNTNWRLITNSGTAYYDVPFTVEGTRLLQTHNRNSSNSVPLTLNGTLANTQSLSGDIPVKVVMGGNWFNYAGIGQEMIFYNSEKSASDQTSIEENVGDYFTQNTPLLDTYTGAAAAYSLRKLSSSYSGPAIRVRRDNDNLETDINFNVFGELDTVSLVAHCGSNNGYVANWYDQSSNSNTARQTTAASQPKIYDSVTGVATDGNKPCLELNPSQQVGTSLTLNNDPIFVACVGSATIDKKGLVGLGGADAYRRFSIEAWPGYNRGFAQWIGNGSTYASAVQSGVNANQSVIISHKLSDDTKMYRNGSLIHTLTDNLDSSGVLGFGYREAVGTGKISEAVIYTSDQTTNRTNIESNITTFYGI